VEESGISEDHPLHSLVKSLSKRLLDARSDSTVTKYYYSFMKWGKFAKEHSLISML
jgi:ferritin-like protein